MADVYKCRMSDYSIVFHLKADSKEQAIEWMRMHTSEDVMRLTSDYSEEYDEEILDIDRTQETADIDISTKDTEYEVNDIQWDVDDEEDLKRLPNDLTIRVSNLTDNMPWVDAENEEDVKEAIIEFLTDKYEYCICSCSITKVA